MSPTPRGASEITDSFDVLKGVLTYIRNYFSEEMKYFGGKIGNRVTEYQRGLKQDYWLTGQFTP